MRAVAGVLLLFTVLTIGLAWPLSRHPATRVLWGGADTELFMWTLAWDAHAFVTNPLAIFDANIFAPMPRTLAYSEHLIGSALFAAPVLWLTANPVLAMNLAALLTVVLCGTGTYFLARRAGVSHAGALIAGLIFAFSPPRFFRLGQLHLTAVQWVPFGLAFLHAFFDTGRARHLWLAAACVTLQALSSGHGTIFLVIAMAALVAWRIGIGAPVIANVRARDLGVAALLLAPVVIVSVPYQLVQQEIGLRRSLVDWAVNSQSYIASPSRFHAWILARVGAADVNATAGAFLFPGYLPLLLAFASVLGMRARSSAQRTSGWLKWFARLLSVVALLLIAIAAYVTFVAPIRFRVGGVLFSARDAWRPWLYAAIAIGARLALARWHPLASRPRLAGMWTRIAAVRVAQRDDATGFYVALTLLSVLLSVGPPLGIWPWVYWLPGLNFIRVPSRFIILAVLGIAVLAGLGLDALLRRASRPTRLVFSAVIGIAMVAELTVAPLTTSPYAFSVPAADRWLASRPGTFTIAEFPPAGTPGALPAARQQTVYMLHSTAHWQKTIHGYSGIEPAGHAKLYAQLRSFPSDESLDALAAWGVRYIVVHPDLYPQDSWRETEKRLERYANRLSLEYSDRNDRVYSLILSPEP